MSHRPPQHKRVRRLVRSMRVPLVASIDLVAWLQSHGHADTAGQARKIILDGRVRSESHTLGKEMVVKLPNGRLVGNPLVAASLRPTLYVTEQA